MVATRPALQTWRAMSGVLQWDRGTPWVAGNSQASALTWTTSSGGKNPGTTRAGTLVQTGQPLFEEALSPHAHNFATGVEARSDLIIGQALGGKKNHPGAEDLKIRQRIFRSPAKQFAFLLRG
jgi:hypothetical protein